MIRTRVHITSCADRGANAEVGHHRRVLVLTMTRRLMLVTALLFATSRTAGTQEAVSLAEVQAVVAGLAKAVAVLPAHPLAPRLQAATRWLQNNVKSTENVSREYVRSLERATAILSSAMFPAAIEDVTRELEVKVDHCRKLGVGMGGFVLLKVNTRRGAQVVGEWQVLYLLKFDEWLKTPPRNFLRVSSPTEMNLEPGRYWIWARDPATGTTSDRVLVEVAGRKELLLDLPVP
jgi:hypothetical protein